MTRKPMFTATRATVAAAAFVDMRRLVLVSSSMSLYIGGICVVSIRQSVDLAVSADCLVSSKEFVTYPQAKDGQLDGQGVLVGAKTFSSEDNQKHT